MRRLKKSAFKRLHELAERCLADLARGGLRPEDIWLSDDPAALEGVKQALLGVAERLESGLLSLIRLDDQNFAAVPELEEWKTIEAEIPGWKHDIELLRPAAHTQNVKDKLISIRVRISELVDALVVRSAVRDPGNRAANSMEAVSTIATLMKERQLRELALGLLEGATWEDALEGSVADWGRGFGPQHRVLLQHFSRKLLDRLEAAKPYGRRSPALAQVVTIADDTGDRLARMYERMLAIPTDQVDAGTASDFHYMSGLAKKLVDAIVLRREAIVSDFDRALPEPVAELFRLLHLSVPKFRRRRLLSQSSLQPLTRKELEAELGRRLTHSTDDDEHGLG